MNASPNGRICEKCEKEIFDFTKKSWNEIKGIQEENNNAVCGMYSPAQLDNWGHEPKGKWNRGKHTIATSSLLLTLLQFNSSETFAQVPDTVLTTNDSLTESVDVVEEMKEVTVKGIVTQLDEHGFPQPAAYVQVYAESLCKGQYTDEFGAYRLILSGTQSELDTATISFRTTNLTQVRHALTAGHKVFVFLDVELPNDTPEITSFYIHVPSKSRKFGRKVKSW